MLGRGGRELVLDAEDGADPPPRLATRAGARQTTFEYIEVCYNRSRLHSSLEYLSPDEYEARKVDHAGELRHDRRLIQHVLDE